LFPLLWVGGCDVDLSNLTPGNGGLPTLGSNTSGTDGTDSGDHVQSPTDKLPAAENLTFKVQTAFCCTPLTVEFSVNQDGPWSPNDNYQWEFGDGRTGSGQTVSHTYPWFKDYVVRLTARRAGGQSTTVHRTLTFVVEGDAIASPVLGPDADNPTDNDPFNDSGLIAVAGPDQIVEPLTEVVLDALASRGEDGGLLNFQWTQATGPTVTLSDPQAPFVTFTAPPGESLPIMLTFELTVTQDSLTARDTVNVIVKSASDTLPGNDTPPWLAELSSLPPLPKVHYSWPMGGGLLKTMDERLLREYVRITRSICVWGEWTDQEGLNRAVTIAGQVNDSGPDIPATIGLVFRPWARVFPPDVPPTYMGPEHDGEIELFESRLSLIKGWLAQANQARPRNPITISAVILECERFFIKEPHEPGYQEWNAAIEVKHNAIYLAAKQAFPNARVEWYARAISKLFTLNELGDNFSVPVYHTPEPIAVRTTFRRAVDAASEHGVNDVTPWVALGSAYVPQPDGSKVWSFEYDYDLSYSWGLGAEINDPWYGDRPTQYAPWHTARRVIFWPAPWEERVPNWPRHFISYVRGAHNIPE
jgi:hypothetical protein